MVELESPTCPAELMLHDFALFEVSRQALLKASGFSTIVPRPKVKLQTKKCAHRSCPAVRAFLRLVVRMRRTRTPFYFSSSKAAVTRVTYEDAMHFWYGA